MVTELESHPGPKAAPRRGGPQVTIAAHLDIAANENNKFNQRQHDHVGRRA